MSFILLLLQVIRTTGVSEVWEVPQCPTEETPEGHKEDLGIDAVMIIIIVMIVQKIIILITASVYYRVI